MSNWIRVDDELPTVRDDFYIWPPVKLKEDHYTASYSDYSKKWSVSYHVGDGFYDLYPVNPTHWRPIEPPKGE